MTAGSTGPLARIGARQVVWIVALAALLAFLPSALTGFVFDDDQLVVRNPYAHDLAYLGRCFSTDLWDTPERPASDLTPKFYRPLVCAANILDFELGRGSASVFHLTNVAAHAGVSALAARLALRWTGSPVAALVGALVFALHPTRSESVVWISGRTDTLATLFLLAACELAVSGSSRKRGSLHFALAAAAFVLGLLSKELAVCLPVLLAVEAALARYDARDDAKARRLGAATVIAALGSALYLVVRAHTLPIRPPELALTPMPPLARAGYVLLTLGYYAERLVFPWPQTFYFRPVAFAGGVPTLYVPSVVLGGLALAALTAGLLVAWRRDRPLAVMLAAFGLLLLPASNVTETFVPTTTADRFLYLPLLPLALAGARRGRCALRSFAETSRLAPLLVSVGALLYSAVSWVRSLDYTSDESMWRHELELCPDSPMALGRLGQSLASWGNFREAEALLRRALTPEALRYQLLANPSLYYLGLLEIQGPRVADGDLPALSALLQDTLRVVDGHLPDPSRHDASLDLPAPPADPAFRIHAQNARTHLLVASTLLASRLPNDAQTRVLAARIDAGAALDPAARYNLALALGRASEYAAARAELSRAVSGGGAAAGVADAASALDATLTLVANLRAEARSLPEPASSVARARAFLELGAYLRAARVLRAAHATYPDDAATKSAYFEALVEAKLTADAEELARSMPGVDAGARVEAARRNLSERVLSEREPPPNVEWWGAL